ncbi:MAG: 4-(cytidine 5'-diphospho)-2-C-methyl-D-erythritol kinase [Acidocella sp. 20-57-95]|nr:MAG: 4-(cytidine 5'-diphospho)-2-C-methyl-D-erythritol kinase [Acidocella sp. 20-57-95]OYV62597.1 MAG: 4-(cytidine 5'-diphospho)-2-C-methyl-D-erythritol kinase [Acidocella sp. 21-58-7]HQT64173.1 4-(cytidine 5'-diphospho)-2-C-methyl-D-erythritol kinase [Acidocella sp.]HQU04695.1 4-(cytidine 5'-diphospho)-2-C-methyl-D-erythritol kinase [Acidocella sp.]
MLQSFAPAKVNLHLHVTGKRADGYHLLDSLAVFPNVGDVLSATPADTLSLTINGPFGESLAAEPDNLVLRAARALNPTGTAAITLTKNLPIASGIGGGSSDAAAALRVLAKLWNLNTPLHPIAATLGADVPVCLARHSANMSGIGEILSPAPILPSFGIILVNPGVHVATPAVFKARHAAFTPAALFPHSWPNAEAMADALSRTRNDLEPPAISLAPVIGDVLTTLKTLPNCLLARMSGSGATCFAIFPTPAAAATAASHLSPPNWWHWAGGLYEPAPTDI